MGALQSRHQSTIRSWRPSRNALAQMTSRREKNPESPNLQRPPPVAHPAAIEGTAMGFELRKTVSGASVAGAPRSDAARPPHRRSLEPNRMCHPVTRWDTTEHHETSRYTKNCVNEAIGRTPLHPGTPPQTHAIPSRRTRNHHGAPQRTGAHHRTKPNPPIAPLVNRPPAQPPNLTPGRLTITCLVLCGWSNPRSPRTPAKKRAWRAD